MRRPVQQLTCGIVKTCVVCQVKPTMLGCVHGEKTKKIK